MGFKPSPSSPLPQPLVQHGGQSTDAARELEQVHRLAAPQVHDADAARLLLGVSRSVIRMPSSDADYRSDRDDNPGRAVPTKSVMLTKGCRLTTLDESDSTAIGSPGLLPETSRELSIES